MFREECKRSSTVTTGGLIQGHQKILGPNEIYCHLIHQRRASHRGQFGTLRWVLSAPSGAKGKGLWVERGAACGWRVRGGKAGRGSGGGANTPAGRPRRRRVWPLRRFSFRPLAPRREHDMRARRTLVRRHRARSREHTRASDVTKLLCCYVPSVKSWTSAVPFVPRALTVAGLQPRYRGFCAPIAVGCVKISGEWERRAVVRLRLVWPHYFRNTYARDPVDRARTIKTL